MLKLVSVWVLKNNWTTAIEADIRPLVYSKLNIVLCLLKIILCHLEEYEMRIRSKYYIHLNKITVHHSVPLGINVDIILSETFQ
jgi:hypothetical protein